MPGGQVEPAVRTEHGGSGHAAADVVDATDEYAVDDAAADVGFAPGRSPIGSATTHQQCPVPHGRFRALAARARWLLPYTRWYSSLTPCLAVDVVGNRLCDHRFHSRY